MQPEDSDSAVEKLFKRYTHGESRMDAGELKEALNDYLEDGEWIHLLFTAGGKLQIMKTT